MLLKIKKRNLFRFDCRLIRKEDCNDCNYYGKCNKIIIDDYTNLLTMNNLCIVGNIKTYRFIYLSQKSYDKLKSYVAAKKIQD